MVKKYKKYTLIDNVFLVKIEIIVGKYKNKINPGEVETINIEYENGMIGKKYILYLFEKDNLPILVHETLHLVKKIFLERGIPFNKNNDEAMAYYQEYLFKKINNIINEKNKML